MDNITQILTYLVITSVAAERLVDMLKRSFLDKYVKNGVIYQLISGVFGASLAYFSPPDFKFINNNLITLAIVTGLAVSGGSSVWNNLLSVLTTYKDSLKKLN